jgi:hypothetical protein
MARSFDHNPATFRGGVMKLALGLIRGLAALIAATAALAAQATPTIYLGKEPNPAETVTGAPVLARSNFLAQLVAGVGSDGFEGTSWGDVGPLALSFPGSVGSITATLNGDGQAENLPGIGTFNTTPGGNMWWETTSGSFDIGFSKPIAAFGFYGTDIGDQAGQIVLTLTDVNNLTSTLQINTTGLEDGSLLFYGFIDTLKTYTHIAFSNSSAGGDAFGFDDMVIGDLGQLLVPPVLALPGTLALFGLALFGVAVARRRV